MVLNTPIGTKFNWLGSVRHVLGSILMVMNFLLLYIFFNQLGFILDVCAFLGILFYTPLRQSSLRHLWRVRDDYLHAIKKIICPPLSHAFPLYFLFVFNLSSCLLCYWSSATARYFFLHSTTEMNESLCLFGKWQFDIFFNNNKQKHNNNDFIDL